MNSGGNGNFFVQMLLIGFGVGIGHFLVRKLFGNSQTRHYGNDPYQNTNQYQHSNSYQQGNSYQQSNPYQQANPYQQSNPYQHNYPSSTNTTPSSNQQGNSYQQSNTQQEVSHGQYYPRGPLSNTPSAGPDNMYNSLSSSLSGMNNNKRI
jgi:hypothetical protein